MARPKKSNRSDGRFEIQRKIGEDANGKRVVKSFYGANKDEALAAYHAFLNQEEKKREERARMLFKKWVEEWLYTYKEPDVKPTTFLTTYERPCRNYILPYFKDTYIQDITPLMIKAFINSISDRSQSLLDKVVICLRGIFETAVDNDVLQKNPCRNVDAKSRATKNEKRVYDKASVDFLCSSDHKYGLLIHILLRMGLRCSELCGLKWEDVDFDKGTLTVERALTTEGGRVYIGDPKSFNSRRTLPIPDDLLIRMRSERGEGFIAMLNGHHITPDHFAERQLEAFYNYMKVDKNLRLSTHELRHTCGTLLYEDTRDIYHVSRFLGHSDIAITSKTYVHSEMTQRKVNLSPKTP